MHNTSRAPTSTCSSLVKAALARKSCARAIHDFSDRAQKPFVPFNCSAVPRDLLESQLFGHRRGAFTGAERDQLGLIRSAADGTLFLDEVGDMSARPSAETAALPRIRRNRTSRRTLAPYRQRPRRCRDQRESRRRRPRRQVPRRPLLPPQCRPPVPEPAARTARRNPGHGEPFRRPRRARTQERPPRGVGRHHGATAALSLARQRPPTPERSPTHGRPRRTQLNHRTGRHLRGILGAMPNLRPAGINGREIAIPLHDKLLPTLSADRIRNDQSRPARTSRPRRTGG